MTTSYTRDRGFTRARRLGRDQEEGVEQLRRMLDDPDIDVADLVAAAVEHCPEHQREDLHQALRELGEDRRGPRSWASDRLERRRLGRDFGPESMTENYSRPIEDFGRSEADRQIREADDRRRMGADMAFDGSPRSRFLVRMFGPAALKIET